MTLERSYEGFVLRRSNKVSLCAPAVVILGSSSFTPPATVRSKKVQFFPGVSRLVQGQIYSVPIKGSWDASKSLVWYAVSSKRPAFQKDGRRVPRWLTNSCPDYFSTVSPQRRDVL